MANRGSSGGRNGPGRKCVVAAGLVVLTVPVAVWWLASGLSRLEPGGTDQIIAFSGFDPGIEQAVGVVALVVLTLSLFLLWRMCARRLDSAWFGVLARLVAAGALLAALGRVVTAKTNGANIGGGMMLFGGVFAFLYLSAGAWDRARRMWR